ncbi:MAG: 50S ribosomal protein L25 [Anaerolineae bacterium]
MAATITLAGTSRADNKTARALRREAIVPGVVYGHRFEAKSVQFDYAAIERVVNSAGTSQAVALSVGEDVAEQTVLIRDVQRDPVTRRILHVDLYALVAGEKLRTSIPLVQHGVAPAVELGGVVMQALEQLDIECVPADMPQSISVDLAALTSLTSHIAVADLDIPSGVTVLVAPETVVASITIPRGLAEEEAAEAEEEAAAEAVESAEETEGGAEEE